VAPLGVKGLTDDSINCSTATGVAYHEKFITDRSSTPIHDTQRHTM